MKTYHRANDGVVMAEVTLKNYKTLLGACRSGLDYLIPRNNNPNGVIALDYLKQALANVEE